MKITDEFTVEQQAWRVLTDLEGIAPCMPGAQLTARDLMRLAGRRRSGWSRCFRASSSWW